MVSSLDCRSTGLYWPGSLQGSLQGSLVILYCVPGKTLGEPVDQSVT